MRHSRMEYRAVTPGALANGQRYYIVPESRLAVHKLSAVVHPKYSFGPVSVAKAVPEGKKNTILLLSGIASVAKDKYGFTRFTFKDFFNKDGKPSKDTRKAGESYVYFSTTPSRIPTIGSVVTADEAKETVGELSPNVLPESLREKTVGNTVAVVSPVAAVTPVAAVSAVSAVSAVTTNVTTPAIQKATDELIAILKLGETHMSVSDILKRKNTPRLENLENRMLLRSSAVRVLPIDYRLPAENYLSYQTVNVSSPYGAIELLLESRYFTIEQKHRYIREMVQKGADPSKALVTAIVLGTDLSILDLLLDLGADSNYVQEYKESDGSRRFLTTPLLAAIPTRIVIPFNSETIHRTLLTLTKLRTFIERDGGLVSANRNSLPDGTPVYETVAHITPKVLEVYQQRLAEHTMLTAKNPYMLAEYQKYTDVLVAAIAYLREQSEKQGEVLAEPGGPLYEEARARAYQGTIGTRNEQIARNRAANEAVRAFMTKGGSRKRTMKKNRRSKC